MAVASLADLGDLLDRTANDPTLDPAVRVANLRELREEIGTLLGCCDRYIGDQENQRESAAISRAHVMIGARENANVRGKLLDGRLMLPEHADQIGLFSHEELDGRERDGTLAEALAVFESVWDEQKHPRDHGRFSRKNELPLWLGGKRTKLVRSVLGSFRDTREKYGVAGQPSPGTGAGGTVYTPERKAFHEQLITKLFRDGGRGKGIAAEPQPEGKRHMVFVAGGPASGKSSADEYMPDVGNSVEIDQDWFKNQIEEFQRLAQARDPYASDAVHRESADLAQAARREAMRRGYNVVVQGTGNSGAGQFAGKIHEAGQSGYHTHVFAVSAPTDVAMGRAQGRAAASGRAVPEEGLRAMHANVSRRWPEVERLAPQLDSLQLFDSREDTRKGGKARLMEHLDPQSHKLMVDDPGLLQEFRDKQNESDGGAIEDPSYV